MENEIQKVYEMMRKLNPDFILNEATFNSSFEDPTQAQAQPAQPQPAQPQAAQPQPQTKASGDNKTYDKAIQANTSLANKSARVNTTTEFPDAFKTWFAKLGYTPEKGNINISRVLANVRKAMIELGYK